MHFPPSHPNIGRVLVVKSLLNDNDVSVSKFRLPIAGRQRFFSKKAKRRGRVTVVVARLRVHAARREVRKAKRKEDSLATFHARAVEAYRVSDAL